MTEPQPPSDVKVNPNSANVIVAKHEKDTRWRWAAVVVIALFVVGRGVTAWNRAQRNQSTPLPATPKLPTEEELNAARQAILQQGQPAEEPTAEADAPSP